MSTHLPSPNGQTKMTRHQARLAVLEIGKAIHDKCMHLGTLSSSQNPPSYIQYLERAVLDWHAAVYEQLEVLFKAINTEKPRPMEIEQHAVTYNILQQLNATAYDCVLACTESEKRLILHQGWNGAIRGSGGASIETVQSLLRDIVMMTNEIMDRWCRVEDAAAGDISESKDDGEGTKSANRKSYMPVHASNSREPPQLFNSASHRIVPRPWYRSFVRRATDAFALRNKRLPLRDMPECPPVNRLVTWVNEVEQTEPGFPNVFPTNKYTIPDTTSRANTK